MPDGAYYRKQAELLASLGSTTSDPRIAGRYNHMALEQLARAEVVEPGAGQQMHEVRERDSRAVDRD